MTYTDITTLITAAANLIGAIAQLIVALRRASG